MSYDIAVSGQLCITSADIGFQMSDIDRSNVVPLCQTFILTGYTVPCVGTVVAWEFCYKFESIYGPVVFYPGIWRITGSDYELIQSNTVQYNQSMSTSNGSCQIVNLSTTDQFTAPTGSVVGLHSNIGAQLLLTYTDSSTTTYQLSGSQTYFRINENTDVLNYNIAIKLHLGKFIECMYTPYSITKYNT